MGKTRIALVSLAIRASLYSPSVHALHALKHSVRANQDLIGEVTLDFIIVELVNFFFHLWLGRRVVFFERLLPLHNCPIRFGRHLRTSIQPSLIK